MAQGAQGPPINLILAIWFYEILNSPSLCSDDVCTFRVGWFRNLRASYVRIISELEKYSITGVERFFDLDNGGRVWCCCYQKQSFWFA
jgi:hypothetical protein